VDEQPCDLRECRRNSGLVLLFEPEHARHLPRPLPGGDHIVFVIDVNGADGLANDVSYVGRSRTGSRKTTTVASSRPRVKSR